jgi:uncharacterized membrane protein YwaF
MTARVVPTALVTLGFLAWAFVSVLSLPNPMGVEHFVAAVLLVSPLALLLWAHVRIAKSWRQNLWLALCSAPVAFVSQFSAVFLAWFKPGWVGVVVFAGLGFALATVCILPVRDINRSKNGAAA